MMATTIRGMPEQLIATRGPHETHLQVDGLPIHHALKLEVLEHADSGFIGARTASLVFRVTNIGIKN